MLIKKILQQITKPVTRPSEVYKSVTAPLEPTGSCFAYFGMVSFFNIIANTLSDEIELFGTEENQADF